MRYLITAIVLAMGLVVWADDNDNSALQGKPAPDFSLSTLTGQTAKLSDQKGKVVLVDFWATWCPPCRKSLPHVQSSSQNAAWTSKGLVVWAVNARESNDDVSKFLTDNHYTFTVPMDQNGTAMGEYGVTGIPTTVIVGRDGTVKNIFVGYGDDSPKMIDDAVEKALAESSQ